MDFRSSRALLSTVICASALALSLSSAASAAKEKDLSGAWEGRNFDRRNLVAPTSDNLISPAQAQAIAALRQQNPNLLVDTDRTTGGLRKLWSATGHLTGPQSGNPEQIAIRFAEQHRVALGLTPEDLAGYEVTDSVTSRGSGVTNIYLRQRHGEIPVYNAQLHATITGDGRVGKIANQFVPNLAGALNTETPAIGASSAIDRLKELVGRLESFTSPSLAILPIRPGEARLVWNFVAETDGRRNWYDVTVDAVDGRVWTLIDWIADDSYKVYEQPVESPMFGSVAPPADARTVQSNPALAEASPFGWHDTNGAAGAESQLTTGNNVHACIDQVSPADECDASSQPDGGPGLDFSPVLDLTQDPNTHAPNRDAAVVNLFYWNNIIHDIEYLYGFDEVAGNFQVNNYGNGGNGGDAVQADAQDGSGTCNANFGTPADGQQPRMQMYLSASSCTSETPRHDGDLDNLVIVHEYGHGISNRLVGGPSNVSCLGNTERPSEGLSDWWGMSLTAIPSQTANTVRGTGTWLFHNLFPNGIRPQPYTLDQNLNDMHYERIEDTSYLVPHGVGSVWAQGYWEVYWALVDEHGFEEDLYSVTGTSGDAGNLRAKVYINEGLKNTACSPGFVDVRDGILQAVMDNYGGADLCLVWEAFAAYGLGFSADQGSSGSRSDQTEAFDLPTACSFGHAGNDVRVCTVGNPDHVQNVLVGPAYTAPPVDMSVVGNPGGTTVLWSEDPVTGPLPETVTLTIQNLGAAAPGVYNIDVTGADTTVPTPLTSTDTFVLTLDAAAPGVTTLLTPVDGAVDQARRPVLVWTAVAEASGYEVEVATDAAFTNIVASASVEAPTWEVDVSLDILTQYFWRVRSTNTCGDGVASAEFDFTTANPTVLLVDDDDNDPNVQATYSSALGSRAVFDVWDVTLEGGEPTLADLDAYRMILWFSGDNFESATSPSAGPQAAAEAALGSYLDLGEGRCVWISSQDYLWDMGGAGHNVPTAFMQNYLGVGTTGISSDNGDYTSVTGSNLFGGLGPFTLAYPFTDFSDRITASATGKIAWTGNNGFVGAVSKQHASSTGIYFAFPWEAFSATDEGTVMDRVFAHCASQIFIDGLESGNTGAWDDVEP